MFAYRCFGVKRTCCWTGLLFRAAYRVAAVVKGLDCARAWAWVVAVTSGWMWPGVGVWRGSRPALWGRQAYMHRPAQWERVTRFVFVLVMN